MEEEDEVWVRRRTLKVFCPLKGIGKKRREGNIYYAMEGTLYGRVRRGTEKPPRDVSALPRWKRDLSVEVRDIKR